MFGFVNLTTKSPALNAFPKIRRKIRPKITSRKLIMHLFFLSRFHRGSSVSNSISKHALDNFLFHVLGGCNDVVAEELVGENDENGGLKGRGKISSSTSGHSSDISNQNKIYAGSGFSNIQSNVNNDLQRNDNESVFVSGQDAPSIDRLNENVENHEKGRQLTRGQHSDAPAGNKSNSKIMKNAIFWVKIGHF